MKYYLVEITETLVKRVVIAADSAEQANQIVSELYENGEIELTYKDYEGGTVGEATIASEFEIENYYIGETEEDK